MNSEFLYFCLMGLGWIFLGGWAVALVTACAIAFREEHGHHSGRPVRT